MSRRAIRWTVWTGLGVLILIVYAVGSRETYLQQLRQEDVRLGVQLQQLVRKNREIDREIRSAKNRIFTDAMHGELEAAMSSIRGLPFKQPVDYQLMSRSELRAYILSKFDAQYTPQEFRNYELALKRMGWIPAGMDLLKTTAALLSEQVAAFYDQDENKLYTFSDMDLHSNLERMILGHELVHALQDQNFEFDRLALKVKDNDDEAVAASALVEGDATYQMEIYLHERYQAEEILGDLKTMLSQKTDQLESAPRFLRDSLVFPYEEGGAFVAELHAKGGNASIDAAFRDPPLSTEQILHPEKYLASPRDLPKPVLMAFRIPATWKKLHENVAGELGIRCLLADAVGEARAVQAAEGWGGDRYVLYELPANHWALVWKSVWDTEKDAREFFNAMEDAYNARYRTAAEAPGASSPDSKGAPADLVFFSVADQKQALAIKDRTVLLLNVPDIKSAQEILSVFRVHP